MAFENFKNDQLDTYTTLDTAPDRYQTLTGTISTDGVFVTGSGTAFLTEIGGGLGQLGINTGTDVLGRCWLFNGDATDPEIRRITDVIDDTHLVLEEGFTTDLAADAVLYVPPSRVKQLSYLALEAGGKVDGVTLVDGEFGGFGDTAPTLWHVDPIIIDGTGGDVRITKFYSN